MVFIVFPQQLIKPNKKGVRTALIAQSVRTPLSGYAYNTQWLYALAWHSSVPLWWPGSKVEHRLSR